MNEWHAKPQESAQKQKNSFFFSRDKKKKVVKNTTSCSVFSFFFFSLQGKRLGHKTAQRNTTTSPILKNDFLIIGK